MTYITINIAIAQCCYGNTRDTCCVCTSGVCIVQHTLCLRRYKNWLELDKPVLDPTQDLPKGTGQVKIYFTFK